jgi:hypothetical protein
MFFLFSFDLFAKEKARKIGREPERRETVGQAEFEHAEEATDLCGNDE